MGHTQSQQVKAVAKPAELQSATSKNKLPPKGAVSLAKPREAPPRPSSKATSRNT